jgi:Flp pilus assembly protein TadD
MAVIVQQLQDGKQAEGIQLLEFVHSNRPEDPAVLYNLGIALSDAGRLDRANECLRRAVELNPGDANILAALGVALGRTGRHDEAVEVLREAVDLDDRNPWVCRSLGAILIQTGRPAEAIPYFQAATRLLPGDQTAWLGLAEAHRLAGNTKKAEEAYRAAVEINPHSDLADTARAGSSQMAQSSFKETGSGVLRPDAVQYCLEAMRRFAGMPPGDLKDLALELAMAGRDGFAVHNPDKRYRVKGLDGEFSGLAMVSFLYVAMQSVAPGAAVGFDLAAEYEQAKRMFKAQI